MTRHRKSEKKLAEEEETQMLRLVADLTSEFDGEEGMFHLGPRTQEAVKLLLTKYGFYHDLFQQLSKLYESFRVSERQAVMELLATGNVSTLTRELLQG